MYFVDCSNCNFDAAGHSGLFLQTHPDVLALVISHGYDPIEDDRPAASRRWEVHSFDPFEAVCAYTFEGDTIRLRVDDELQIETIANPASE